MRRLRRDGGSRRGTYTRKRGHFGAFGTFGTLACHAMGSGKAMIGRLAGFMGIELCHIGL